MKNVISIENFLRVKSLPNENKEPLISDLSSHVQHLLTNLTNLQARLSLLGSEMKKPQSPETSRWVAEQLDATSGELASAFVGLAKASLQIMDWRRA